MPVEEIDNSRHPVKIGLSDAYYMDKTVSSGKKNSHVWTIINTLYCTCLHFRKLMCMRRALNYAVLLFDKYCGEACACQKVMSEMSSAVQKLIFLEISISQSF